MSPCLDPYLFGLAEKATGLSSSGFYVIVGAAILGLLLVPLLAKAIDAEPTPRVAQPVTE